MPLLIRNGTVVTSSDTFPADVFCENGKVTSVGLAPHPLPPGTTVIDAAGKYVFPGFIDPHVHIYLPFMGTYAKDTYPTASKAAVAGGTTTLIEMACPARSDDLLEAFELWKGKGTGQSVCDFTFHMGVTKFDAATESQLREIVRAGVASFKIFLAYKGAFGIDDTELYKTLKLAKELGVIVTAHCENADLVSARCAALLAEGKTGPEWHEPSRPESVEAEGVNHLMTFAELLGTHVYTVHTSCQPAVERALLARQRGVNVWIETLIQYLTLDHTHAERPNFEGSKYVMSPPLRHKRNQPYLWTNLENGNIATVATDHAPFDFATQKVMGKTDFTRIPNGIPSLEDRVSVLFSEGVAKGRLSLNRFVDIASTQAARLFGLYPRKGSVRVGADADLVIFNPNGKRTLSVKTQLMNVDYNPFEGLEVTGTVETVIVNGHIAAEHGKFTGNPTAGRFLQREPTHF